MQGEFDDPGQICSRSEPSPNLKAPIQQRLRKIWGHNLWPQNRPLFERLPCHLGV